MAECKNCIKQDVCNRDVGHGYARCPRYVSSDVAPRAEVAREIFYDIDGALECAYDCDQDSDYPIPHYNDYLKEYIAELKKKYTEE